MNDTPNTNRQYAKKVVTAMLEAEVFDMTGALMDLGWLSPSYNVAQLEKVARVLHPEAFEDSAWPADHLQADAVQRAFEKAREVFKALLPEGD